MRLIFLLTALLFSFYSYAQQGQLIKGHIEQHIADDFDNHSHEISTFVKELNTQRLIELKSKDPKLRGLKTGTKVQVRGNPNADGSLSLENIIVEEEAPSASSTTTAGAINMRSVLMIKVNFSDSANSCGDSYFNEKTFGAANSVSGLFEETSKGRIGFTGAATPAVANISGRSDDANCPYSTWASQAREELNRQGVSTSGYNHIVYHFPKSSTCGGVAGRGTLGGGSVWIFGNCLQDVLAHEFGHNLTMHHAGKNNEYGDRSDIMGYGGVGLRQVSSARMIRQGWIENSQYQNGGIGQYDLAPLELTATEAAGRLQVLVYQDAVETNKKWYLSYRQRIGYDSNLGTAYIGGVNVHSSLNDGYKTNLEATLTDGASFSDPNGTFQVTQLSHDANGVRFSVTANCTHRAPTLAVSPSSFSASPGDTRTLNLTLTNNDSTVCGNSDFQAMYSAAAGLSLNKSREVLDVAPGASVSTTIQVAVSDAITDGSHVMSFQAANANDTNKSASASSTVIVDRTAPTVPSGLSASSGRNSVNLSWNASSDASAVTYEVLRDGSSLGTTTNTSFTDSNVTSGTTYSYQVRARDAAGNLSALSSSVSVTYTTTKKGGGKKGGGGSDGGGGGPRPGKGWNK